MNIVKEYKGEKVVIVVYGGIIKVMFIGIFGWDMIMYYKMVLGNICINIVIFDINLKLVLLGLNDINYLNYSVKIV